MSHETELAMAKAEMREDGLNKKLFLAAVRLIVKGLPTEDLSILDLGFNKTTIPLQKQEKDLDL